ncbi:MAG TPA: hypothetical protein VG838_11560 [Opitutaceae bacterium]|nr:hypothetical protein [Opitutaceae bacterium]
MKKIILAYLSVLSCALAATRTEKIRNDRVIAYEESLAPAETEMLAEDLPSAIVFLSEGTLTDGTSAAIPAHRGQVVFRAARAGALRGAGAAEVRFVRIEFRGRESGETWGTTGYAPDYRTLLENGFARIYNIQIAAGHREPQHTHHDRVVVALSGAELRHVLPDGHQEDSSLKTGEILWRLGQTHVGMNIGRTDLWVIAIEPK